MSSERMATERSGRAMQHGFTSVAQLGKVGMSFSRRPSRAEDIGFKLGAVLGFLLPIPLLAVAPERIQIAVGRFGPGCFIFGICVLGAKVTGTLLMVMVGLCRWFILRKLRGQPNWSSKPWWLQSCEVVIE